MTKETMINRLAIAIVVVMTLATATVTVTPDATGAMVALTALMVVTILGMVAVMADVTADRVLVPLNKEKCNEILVKCTPDGLCYGPSYSRELARVRSTEHERQWDNGVSER